MDPSTSPLADPDTLGALARLVSPGLLAQIPLIALLVEAILRWTPLGRWRSYGFVVSLLVGCALSVTGLADLAPGAWNFSAAAVVAGLAAGALASIGYKAVHEARKSLLDSAGPFLHSSPAILVALSLGVALSIGGCQAPAAVRGAHDLAAEAMRVYSANSARLLDGTLAAYRLERDARTQEAVERSLTLTAQAVAARETPEEIVAGVRALVAERDKALADTARVVAGFRKVEDVNRAELAKSLQLHGAVAEWLEAGVDASTVPALVQALVEELKHGPGR